MDGKKFRAFGENCKAVSEVYGQLLMISIVVIAFSGIALTVYSGGGIENPPHTPHTDLQEIINTSDDTIQIFHVGGEAIDLAAIKIILSANGQQTEFGKSDFKVKNPDGSDSTGDALMFGDCIAINTAGKGVNLMSGDPIDMFVFHAPSEQVIQKTVLQRISWEHPEWITPYPYGSICDKSGNNSETFLPIKLVGWVNDGLETDCHMVNGVKSYEIFTFGIEQYELNIKDPIKNVSLNVVYSSHDNSQKDMILEINVGGPNWIKVADLKGPNKKGTYQEIFPITDKVNTVAKIENLSMRFSAVGKPASNNKDVWIDFVGVHVES